MAEEEEGSMEEMEEEPSPIKEAREEAEKRGAIDKEVRLRLGRGGEERSLCFEGEEMESNPRREKARNRLGLWEAECSLRLEETGARMEEEAERNLRSKETENRPEEEEAECSLCSEEMRDRTEEEEAECNLCSEETEDRPEEEAERNPRSEETWERPKKEAERNLRSEETENRPEEEMGREEVRLRSEGEIEDHPRLQAEEEDIEKDGVKSKLFLKEAMRGRRHLEEEIEDRLYCEEKVEEDSKEEIEEDSKEEIEGDHIHLEEAEGEEGREVAVEEEDMPLEDYLKRRFWLTHGREVVAPKEMTGEM